MIRIQHVDIRAHVQEALLGAAVAAAAVVVTTAVQQRQQILLKVPPSNLDVVVRSAASQRRHQQQQCCGRILCSIVLQGTVSTSGCSHSGHTSCWHSLGLKSMVLKPSLISSRFVAAAGCTMLVLPSDGSVSLLNQTCDCHHYNIVAA